MGGGQKDAVKYALMCRIASQNHDNPSKDISSAQLRNAASEQEDLDLSPNASTHKQSDISNYFHSESWFLDL